MASVRLDGRLVLSISISFFVFLFVLPSQALAWGSITHSAICKDAGGSELFIMGGVAPDMIALHAVTTGDGSYDYAHNCYGDTREPVFGNILASISSSDFAAGWRAHQLADSIVHGAGGYSTTKTLFKSLPGQYGNDINHGAVELVVDAIILEGYYGGNVSLYVPDQSELIHEGSIAFFNRGGRVAGAIPRANIIDCAVAGELSFHWENCLQTNIFLASMLSEEPWFSDVREECSDYRIPYDRSVALLNGVSALQEDNYGIVQAFVDTLVPPQIAKAAESTSVNETNSTYYSFLNEVSERAREIGGGKATKESTRQAIDELNNDASVPAEQRAWAETMAEMTSGRNKSRTELEASVTERLGKGRDGSAKGAKGGRKIRLLPYLPCSIAVFLVAVVTVRIIRSRRR